MSGSVAVAADRWRHHRFHGVRPSLHRFLLFDWLFINFFFICLLQEDLLIHGDSVYDIVDKQDHGSVQSEMGRAVGVGGGSVGGADDSRLFLCRMNVSRNARRQMRFGDQKVSFSIHLFKNTRASRRIPEDPCPVGSFGMVRRLLRDSNAIYRHFDDSQPNMNSSISFAVRGVCERVTERHLAANQKYNQILEIGMCRY